MKYSLKICLLITITALAFLFSGNATAKLPGVGDHVSCVFDASHANEDWSTITADSHDTSYVFGLCQGQGGTASIVTTPSSDLYLDWESIGFG